MKHSVIILLFFIMLLIQFQAYTNKNSIRKNEYNIKRIEYKVQKLQRNIDSLNYILLYKDKQVDSLENIISKIYSLNKFLYDIGNRESGNNYLAKNDLGFLGRYQFGMSTIRTLGYNVDSLTFLTQPIIQEKVMAANLKYNFKILSKHFDTVTSGMLAAAHLGGAGNVIKRNFHKKDTFGTSIRDYYNEFEGYDLSLLYE